jgi:putative membrane protein
MIALLVSWVACALALFLSAKIFSGVRLKGDFGDALWIAAVYSIISFFLGWLIFGLLGVVTLGLGFVFFFITQLVTAAIVLKVTSALSSRFDIVGFVPALGTAIMLAIASAFAQRLLS